MYIYVYMLTHIYVYLNIYVHIDTYFASVDVILLFFCVASQVSYERVQSLYICVNIYVCVCIYVSTYTSFYK